MYAHWQSRTGRIILELTDDEAEELVAQLSAGLGRIRGRARVVQRIYEQVPELLRQAEARRFPQ